MSPRNIVIEVRVVSSEMDDAAFFVGAIEELKFCSKGVSFFPPQKRSSPSLNLSKSRYLTVSARKIEVYIYNMANEAKEHRKSMNALLNDPR